MEIHSSVSSEVNSWPKGKDFRDLDRRRISDANIKCEIIVGQKLTHRFLKCEDYLFTKHDFGAFGCTFRCRNRSCPARLLLLPSCECVRLTDAKDHNHSDNFAEDIINWAALNAMKSKCADLRNVAGGRRLAKVKDIFTEVMVENQSASLALDKIERGLQKIKKGALPKTPESIDEINSAFQESAVIESYGQTLQLVDIDGEKLTERHLFFDVAIENKAKEYSFCVFSSKTTIELIHRHIPLPERHILMDATFRIVPFGPFSQFFILYIRKHKKVFPFVYVLMSRKTQATYEHVFRYIDENIFQLRGVASYTSDYEVAMRNALRVLDPSVKRFACYFHYTQAVKRRAWQTAGLVELIRSNPRARSVYHRMQCLPLLPAEFIVDAFRSLRTEAMAIDKNAFQLFFEYYHRQWIIKEGAECISVNGTTMRTTSSVESNNRVMNDTVVNKGNFFTFVHDMRLQEFHSSLKLRQHFESGGKCKPPRKQYKLRDDEIARVSTDLRNGLLSPMEFLRQLTYDNDNWVRNFDTFETVAYDDEVEFEFDEVEFEFDEESDRVLVPLVSACPSTLSQDSGVVDDAIIDPYVFGVDLPSSPLVLRKKNKRNREDDIDETETRVRKRLKKSCVSEPVTKKKSNKQRSKKNKK
ncbi:uncharacterized protein LOC129572155 [Sitodiplosis mosellana]|uniref:uncharacterized protein LOC129572155 n=1 Tax=Sitodiplosis mosellana TaxID=263140 RepID=UPI002443CE43|nr:uncharacterized protein LOC129572155 [Sitodiplosis mosellana]